MTSHLPDDPEAIRAVVRERYGSVARHTQSCCGPSPAAVQAQIVGYSAEELNLLPEGANLGLGCGNPTALAALAPSEVVVDLGAGAGIDAFIAARAVGPTGRVIGVDMTPEMLQAARANAVEAGVHGYVEFREGLIEALPVASNSADVVISNCVINLSTDKPAVFREAFRVLKSGGRLAVSDILLSQPLPPEVRDLASAYVGCVAGAIVADDYLQAIADAGFVDVRSTRTSAAAMFGATDPIALAAIDEIGLDRARSLVETVWSYKIEARKP